MRQHEVQAKRKTFQGNTLDMLRYCMKVWWREEVTNPGCALIRCILQRGVDREEFCALLHGLCTRPAHGRDDRRIKR